MTNADAETHVDACVVFCVDDGCRERHACWCPEGSLSFDAFADRHPRWRDMPYARWLDTDDGAAWLASNWWSHATARTERAWWSSTSN